MGKVIAAFWLSTELKSWLPGQWFDRLFRLRDIRKHPARRDPLNLLRMILPLLAFCARFFEVKTWWAPDLPAVAVGLSPPVAVRLYPPVVYSAAPMASVVLVVRARADPLWLLRLSL